MLRIDHEYRAKTVFQSKLKGTKRRGKPKTTLSFYERNLIKSKQNGYANLEKSGEILLRLLEASTQNYLACFRQGLDSLEKILVIQR